MRNFRRFLREEIHAVLGLTVSNMYICGLKLQSKFNLKDLDIDDIILI
jgi:hypothetical protein